MQFHAFEVKKEYRLQLPKNYCFHLSVISASSELKKNGGNAVLYATVDGKMFSLGTISTSQNSLITTALQISTDLIFSANQEVSFQVHGGKSLNCIGYVQALGNEEEDFLGSDSSDENGSLEEEEDDFQLPIETALRHSGKKGGKHPRVEEVKAESEGSENVKKKMEEDLTQVTDEMEGSE